MSQPTTKKCPICLCKHTLPIKLECCGQIVDYLCFKGILLSNLSNNCPLCRHPLNTDLLEKIDKDQLVDTGYNDSSDESSNDNSNDSTQCVTDYQWYFAGRNFGWWQYDPNSNKDINRLYKKYESDNNSNNDVITIGSSRFKLDFENGLQINLKSGAQRKIKKEDRYNKNIMVDDDSDDQSNLHKGIAGIQM